MQSQLLIFSLLAASCAVQAAGQQAPANAANPATVPADRLSEPWWAARHQAVLSAVQSHPDAQLLLVGDSITHNYDKATLPDENFQPIWKEFYEPRKALNLGFSGDTTANVLWRLDHGEVQGLHPKAVVLLIGTNNTGWKEQTSEQAEAGIDAVVAELQRLLPQTNILLLGILPSDLSASKTQRDHAVNDYLAARYRAVPQVTYLDIGSVFYKNGSLDTSIFCDPRLPWHGGALHPDTIGQRRMAMAVEPVLTKLMGETPRASSAADTPTLDFVFEESVTLAPGVKVGTTPFGERNIVPITGGTFSGPRIKGKILPGGWDWQLAGQGGCFSLHADYMIQTDDGVTINVVNAGSMCKTDKAEPSRLLTVPVFEAPKGAYEWLNGGVYIGTLEVTGSGANFGVHIRFYKAR
jgi:lysophospholipase L1-like esterase